MSPVARAKLAQALRLAADAIEFDDEEDAAPRKRRRQGSRVPPSPSAEQRAQITDLGRTRAADALRRNGLLTGGT